MVDFDTDKGAQFIKSDLHLHTPGSFDYEDDSVDPSDLVARFEEEGLGLVAVTDHNTTGYYQKLKEAAADSPVSVLPGVEITTGNSGEHQIHMTAIFPPKKSDRIKYVLDSVGIDQKDPQNAITDVTIPKVCEEVRNEDGLPILAHIDKKAGALFEMGAKNTPSKVAVFEDADTAALEIVNRETEKEFPNRAQVRSSDAHHPDHIGSRYTYLKMSDPSFEGLRTALSDPESRISIEQHLNSHASIDGLQVTNGFLQNRHLQFNKNLNCLIGGKGTGKSTVIEHIRYALDITPRSEAIAKEYRELIDHTLGSDGTIQLLLTGNNGSQYRITRGANSMPTIERVVPENEGDTSDRQFEPVDLPIDQFRNEFFNVEIHSQRELIELARNQTDQLNLLDKYFGVDEAIQKRDSLKDDIRGQSRRIQTLEEEVESLTEDKHRFDTLKQQVELMKEKGVDEYVEGQEDWEHERAEFTTTISDIESIRENIDGLTIFDEISEVSVEQGPNKELLQSVHKIVDDLESELQNYKAEIIETVDEAYNDIEELRDQWQERNEEREAEHAALKDEIESQIDVDIDQFFEKQARLNDLQDVATELDKKEEELAEAKEQKEELFNKLENARQNLTEARKDGISELNGELNDVRISIQSQANKKEYTDWINHVLEGSRVYTEDKEQIAASFEPRELARIVREYDTEQLEQAAGVSSVAAENFVNHDDLREQLIKLELFEIRDRPIIELNDSGWKELKEMSDGQQCTALLSIAMIERDVPLIIDQPEDMLDNQFIFSEVVSLIRNIKHDRQIISATHNANIPVLGDAEQIIVMRSNGLNGFFSCCGSIDDDNVKELAQDILEGGEQAFRQRDEKYRQVA